jgi:hypothetical protein
MLPCGREPGGAASGAAVAPGGRGARAHRFPRGAAAHRHRQGVPTLVFPEGVVKRVLDVDSYTL